MKIYKYILLVFFMVIATKAQNKPAENKEEEELKPGLGIICRVQKNKILLRWTANTPIAWKKSNTYGYTLERYTITRNKKTLAVPEKVILAEAMKPEPLAAWENSIETNENAAIIAQALYGESFEMTGGSDIENIVNLSEEIEQRFTFALFAADKDFEIAKKAGLGFEDTTAKANEKYAYRILSNVPEKEFAIAYGGLYTGLDEYDVLPKPMDFTAHFTDASAMLSWNFKILQHAYGSYYVERSVDKKQFERITAKPYTSMNQANTNTNRIFYVDSIANNQEYHYRIQGISAFGELGPYSDIVSGKSKSILKYVPHLTVKDFKDENTVTLSWEFPEEGNEEIEGFELNRADSDEEPYSVVQKNIPAKDRSVLVNKLKPTNYFTITALGKNKGTTTSFPMLVQPVDSIPPAKPMGLKAEIDSLGIVKIQWEANKESDMLGYRIYKAYNPNEEYSQLTVSPSPATNYQDSVVVKSLNSKVYYKIKAIDYRYNMSDFSEVLTVKKPDVIPPTPPIFVNYEQKEGAIHLEWINSQSPDVAVHQLYRKENEEATWQLILETTKSDEKYTDTKIIEGNRYRYAIFATDESKLVSAPSPQVVLVAPKISLLPAVKNFYAQNNLQNNSIDLSWNYKETQNLEGFELYKAANNEPLQLMQIVTATMRLLPDPSIAINTNYKYGIRAVATDGRFSKMEFFEIKY